MKDYTLKGVSVTFDNATFMDKLVSNTIPQIAADKNVVVIPTIAYKILKEQMKKGNDNYTFVNAYLEIIKTLYVFDNQEIYSNKLRNIIKDYKSILNMLRPIILKSEYPEYNVETKQKEGRTIHTMRSYNDLTFVTLIDKKDYNIVEIDFDYEGLKDTPVDNDLFINTLTKAKLDARSAIYAEFQYINSNKFITTNDKKDKYKVFITRVNAILNFLSVRKATKGKKVNRVYSSFTALSKVSRKYLTMNNKPFIEIDIKNCQPLLLAVLASENKLSIDLDYVNNVVNGTFYESLMNKAIELGYEEEKIFERLQKIDNNIKIPITKTLKFDNRDHVKVMCYNDIFFANKHKETKLVKVFKTLYPKTYKTIIELSNKFTLAHLLQDLEAEIVLNIVPNSPYFTVHDAIYLTRTTEIKNTMKAIEDEIYNRSGGLIKSIKFGELEDNKITIIDDCVDKDIEILNVKERKPHSIKEIKINSFIKMYEDGMKQNEIIEILNISYRTFLRYKKQYINKIEE